MRILDRLRRFAAPVNPVLSLEVQASLAADQRKEYGQWWLLVRHFLDRFLNNEMMATEEDGLARLIQIACATSMPGFVFALPLWPLYHSLFRGPRPYWGQVSDHFFYVMYSFVAMGIATIFEWDQFFPNLLDLFILSPLPIQSRKLFLARIAAVTVFVFGFLINANLLGALALPAATDPHHLLRFFVAYLLAVGMSGLFAAIAVLALQGGLLAILGARLFRRISLFLQGFLITILILLLFLLPMFSGTLSVFLHSSGDWALNFPPFWFLGIYQRVLEGPSAQPVYARLAHTGYISTLVLLVIALLSYPIAYWRRIRQLIEGIGVRSTRSWLAAPVHSVLHGICVRRPQRRAIHHFISQTVTRVPRYRIHLILYGGLGLALVMSSILRLQVEQGRIHLAFSPDGIRATIPIVAFWVIAGLRMAFLSASDSRSNWIFHVTQGRPGWDHLEATKLWVFLCSGCLTLGAIAALHGISPVALHTWKGIAGQVLVATALCRLLTDVFFIHVKVIPFTSAPASTSKNIALLLIPFLGLFPPLVGITVGIEPWIEASVRHLAITLAVVVLAHLILRASHKKQVAYAASLWEVTGEEDEFPLRLGLRF